MSLFAVTVNRVVTNSIAAATDVIYALCMNSNDDKSHAQLMPRDVSHTLKPLALCAFSLWQQLDKNNSL